MPAETADNYFDEFAEEPPEDALYKHSQQHAIAPSREEAFFITSFEQYIEAREAEKKERLKSLLAFRTPSKRVASPSRLFGSSSRRINSLRETSPTKQQPAQIGRFECSIQVLPDSKPLHSTRPAQAGRHSSRGSLLKESMALPANHNHRRILRAQPKTHRIRTNSNDHSFASASKPQRPSLKADSQTDITKEGVSLNTSRDLATNASRAGDKNRSALRVFLKKKLAGHLSSQRPSFYAPDQTPEQTTLEQVTRSMIRQSLGPEGLYEAAPRRPSLAHEAPPESKLKSYQRFVLRHRRTQTQPRGRAKNEVFSRSELMREIEVQELINEQAASRQSKRRQFASVAGFAQLLGEFATSKRVMFMKYRTAEDQLRPPNRWVRTVLAHPQVFHMKKYLAYRKSLMRSQEGQTEAPVLQPRVDHLALNSLDLKDRANSVASREARGSSRRWSCWAGR